MLGREDSLELRSVAGKGLEYLFCSLATSVIEKFFFQEILSPYFFLNLIFEEMSIAGKVEFCWEGQEPSGKGFAPERIAGPPSS